jgi:hypothetical protein
VVRPVITAELAKNVSQLRIFDSEEDLEGCFSVFATSYPNQASIAAANNYNCIHDHHAVGGVHHTLAEGMDIKKAQAMKLPISWVELLHVLSAHHRFLQVLLGKAHTAALAFRNLNSKTFLAAFRFSSHGNWAMAGLLLC